MPLSLKEYEEKHSIKKVSSGVGFSPKYTNKCPLISALTTYHNYYKRYQDVYRYTTIYAYMLKHKKTYGTVFKKDGLRRVTKSNFVDFRMLLPHWFMSISIIVYFVNEYGMHKAGTIGSGGGHSERPIHVIFNGVHYDSTEITNEDKFWKTHKCIIFRKSNQCGLWDDLKLLMIYNDEDIYKLVCDHICNITKLSLNKITKDDIRRTINNTAQEYNKHCANYESINFSKVDVESIYNFMAVYNMYCVITSITNIHNGINNYENFRDAINEIIKICGKPTDAQKLKTFIANNYDAYKLVNCSSFNKDVDINAIDYEFIVKMVNNNIAYHFVAFCALIDGTHSDTQLRDAARYTRDFMEEDKSEMTQENVKRLFRQELQKYKNILMTCSFSTIRGKTTDPDKIRFDLIITRII